MIAVIRTGGKQYTVAPEETHEIERIPGEAGAQVEFTDVLMENGSLTEIFRADWLPGPVVRHVFQRLLPSGKVSAWHAHATTIDRLFCGYGTVRITLR